MKRNLDPLSVSLLRVHSVHVVICLQLKPSLESTAGVEHLEPIRNELLKRLQVKQSD